MLVALATLIMTLELGDVHLPRLKQSQRAENTVRNCTGTRHFWSTRSEWLVRGGWLRCSPSAASDKRGGRQKFSQIDVLCKVCDEF